MPQINNKNGLTLKDLRDLVKQMEGRNNNIPIKFLTQDDPVFDYDIKSVIGDDESIIFYDFI